MELQRKEITLYFPQTSDVWPHPWRRASTHVAVDREDRRIHNESLPLLTSSLFTLLLLSVTSYGMEYPFGWFRSAALGMFLSHFFTHPQPAVSGRGGS